MKSPNRRPANQSKQVSAGAKGSKRPPGKTKNSRTLWITFCIGGVAMLSAGAGALLAVSLASTPLMQRPMSPTEAAVFGKGGIATRSSMQLPELTRPVNIMVLGTKVLTTDIDNPPDDLKKLHYQALVNSFEGLTDTMLLLRFNPEAKKLSLLSIPRDTRTYIPEHGVKKINEANVYGGPALSAKSMSDLLGGVGIDRYVNINVQGVQALVEALGGVTVYVPKDMKYRDESQHLFINLKAGKQHLNGDQALQLLRFRYDENGDIGRIQRQQMVIRALMEQALNPATVTRIPQILEVVKTHIDTNLTVEELVALVGFAAQVNRSNTQMLMVPGDFSAPGAYDASYWLPNPGKIQEVMSRHFDFGAPVLAEAQPAAVRVAIQDSTSQTSSSPSPATQTVQELLNGAGYSNVFIGRPWSEPLSITRIVAQQGDINGAEAVRRSLGFGEIRIENTGTLDSDVTIQLGKDALRSKKPDAKADKADSKVAPTKGR